MISGEPHSRVARQPGPTQPGTHTKGTRRQLEVVPPDEILSSECLGRARRRGPELSAKSTSFRYPCYRHLKKRLGEADAAAQFAEIAVRELSGQLRNASDPKAVLRSMSTKHKVKTDYVDLTVAHRQLSSLHIVAVIGEFEQFLEDLRDSHPDGARWTYGPKSHAEGEPETRKKDRKEQLLVRIIRNLSASIPDARIQLGALDYDLYLYYRLVRNRAAHAEASSMGLDSKIPSLRERVVQDAEYQRLAAPNELGSVTFDDFILCTRVVKRLAAAMCTLARPSDKQIAEMVSATLSMDQVSANDRTRGRPDLRALRNNPKRQRTALTTVLRQEYSLTSDEALPIVDILSRSGSLA